MRAMAIASAAAAVVLALVIAESCAVEGFDLVDPPPAQGGGGTSGSAGDGGVAGAGACQSIEPPLAPGVTDPGTDVDFVAAIRTLDFGEDFDANVGPEVGYDLDAKCTCTVDQGSCATVGNEPVECDGPRGRDNAVARLFKNLGLFEPDTFNSQYHSGQANMGNWSLLIRVRDYNGAPNDEDVTVAVYPSPGLGEDACLPSATPMWDGNDRWPVDSLAVLGGLGGGGAGGTGGTGGGGGGTAGAGGCSSGEPGYDVDNAAFVSSLAYVTESVLVATLPEAGLVLSADGQTVQLKLVAGFVTARLEQSGSGWFMRSGVLTGRWSLAEFFGFIGDFTTGGEHICRDSSLYGPVKELVCNYADIHTGVQAPAAPCDAMSFGMGFEAEPAQLGVVVELAGNGGGGAGGCAPGQDPTGDTCEQ